MFLMRADTLRGGVGERWALEIGAFMGPVQWHQAVRRMPLGPKKVRLIWSPDGVIYLFAG